MNIILNLYFKIIEVWPTKANTAEWSKELYAGQPYFLTTFNSVFETGSILFFVKAAIQLSS